MDELLPILDSQGMDNGKIAMKSEAHRKGWFHPTVHIWCYTLEGSILLQRRAATKKTFPLLWDVSVAGHVCAGETILVSAQREIEEEIGLRISPDTLEKIGVFKSVHRHHKEFIDCEFQHTYLCLLKVPFHQLKKQESEVAALKLIPLAAFETTYLQPEFVPHQKNYYDTVIKYLKQKL